MAKAINMIVGQDFISDNDEDEVKTIWKVRTLNGFEFLECTSQGFFDHALCIHKGLTGWENFKDIAGNDIEFSDDNISLIPALILQEISLEIQIMSSLTEDERKN